MVSIRMGNIEINKQNAKLSHNNNNNQTQMAHGGFIFDECSFFRGCSKELNAITKQQNLAATSFLSTYGR
jgi:hypothetical protein